MKKLSVSLAAVAVALFLSFSPVLAQYGQYEVAPTPSLLVDKTVGKVTTDKGSTTLEFVDNLSPSDPRFRAGSVVEFRLKVTNSSDATLENVQVVDQLP